MVENKCAYVYLAMNNIEYALGAIVSCPTKTKHDTILMLTPDIPVWVQERASASFDRVVIINKLTRKTYRRPKSALVKDRYSGNTRYDSWIDSSFTKWQMLNFIEYDKVLFVDADIIFKSDQYSDELFNLQAPAATFSSAWAKPHDVRNIYSVETLQPDIEHGQQFELDDMMAQLQQKCDIVTAKKKQTGYVLANAGLVLLCPKKHQPLLSLYWLSLPRSEEFGDPQCHSAPDEQFLCNSLRTCTWTHIHQRYQATPSRNWGVDFKEAKGIHFISKNPWEFQRITPIYKKQENTLLSQALHIWWQRFDQQLTPSIVRMLHKSAHRNILPHHKIHKEYTRRKREANTDKYEQRIAEYKMRPICIFFANGGCKRGDGCNFKHDK